MSECYPVFLRLDDRLCLIVGGGPVAARKLLALCDTGARVRVVASAIGQEMCNALTKLPQTQVYERCFETGDLDGCALVIAATDNQTVNETIYNAARERNILCNVVDVPHLCDFFVPSVIRRGILTLAISTSGHAPGFSRLVRKTLEPFLGPEYAQLAEAAVELRQRVRERYPDAPEERSRILKQHMNTPELSRALTGDDTSLTGAVCEKWKSCSLD